MLTLGLPLAKVSTRAPAFVRNSIEPRPRLMASEKMRVRFALGSTLVALAVGGCDTNVGATRSVGVKKIDSEKGTPVLRWKMSARVAFL
jgi:hypothetical protein